MRLTPHMMILLALFASHCSQSPKKSDHRDHESPTHGMPGADGEIDPITEIPLVELPARGSQMRFLDAVALTDVYSRVFKKDANGNWKGCGNEKSWCDKSLFNKDEAKTLGTFSLLEGVDSFRGKKDFSLNYTRSLRAALYRECKNLVDAEWERAASTEGAKQNVLISQRGLPATADLDRFSRQLFGLTGSSLAIDNSAEEYRQAFSASVPNKTDANALKSGYVVVCMAMTMDPAVFLY